MIDLNRPVNLAAKEFVNNKYEWYEHIREQKPVHRAKISVMTVYTVARYEDCANLLNDPRVIRNRSTATGGSRFPIPMPKSVKPLVESMIQEDNPNHRRLRELVRKGFRPQAIATLEKRIDSYAHELLDGLESAEQFDLQLQYALPIPMRMIGDMLGVPREAVPEFQKLFNVLTKGFTALRMAKTLLWDLPDTVKYVRGLVSDKRARLQAELDPGEDILSGLIQAEDDGDRLSEDELVAMVFLLIVAGFETTVHLITNGMLTLLQHPEQLQRLRDNPDMINTAVEEILRHRGPVHSTKPGYATEDITLHGVTIPKGVPVMPLLGAANHDPRVFDNPQQFDIGRTPNRHLGFGHGIHFCLGAHLARAEARIAISSIIKRFEDLDLAVAAATLQPQRMPGWHRYSGLPLRKHVRRAAA